MVIILGIIDFLFILLCVFTYLNIYYSIIRYDKSFPTSLFLFYLLKPKDFLCKIHNVDVRNKIGKKLKLFYCVFFLTIFSDICFVIIRWGYYEN